MILNFECKVTKIRILKPVKIPYLLGRVETFFRLFAADAENVATDMSSAILDTEKNNKASRKNSAASNLNSGP